MGESMDHKEFLIGLPKETRQNLLTRSDRAGLQHLALHWGLILVVGCLIAYKMPFWPLLLPVQGILIIFTFTLLHECTHKTPFRTPWLNEVVGWISGFAVGLPFLWFRYFHFAHHKYTNDPAKDPELLGHAKPETWREYLWHLSGLRVWKVQATGLFDIASGREYQSYLPKSKRRVFQVESIIIVSLYLLIAFYSLTTSLIPIMVWILPVFLGQPFLRLYLLAEHGRCPAVANMFENSRTTLTNRVIRFLAWNMPHHAEHHAYPNVPFYRLPDLSRMVLPHLKTLQRGYYSFHRDYTKGFQQAELKGDL